MSADKLFERRWALTLLEQVLSRLRDEQAAAGQGEAFEQLKEFLLAGGRGTPYAELAARLGRSEGAVKRRCIACGSGIGICYKRKSPTR